MTFGALQAYAAIGDFKKLSHTLSHLIWAQLSEGASGKSSLLKVKLKSEKARTQTLIFCLSGLNTFQYMPILKNIIIGASIVQCTH